MAIETKLVYKISSNIKNSIEISYFGRSQIIFPLLNKIIMAYIRLILIYIKGFGFVKFFLDFINDF